MTTSTTAPAETPRRRPLSLASRHAGLLALYVLVLALAWVLPFGELALPTLVGDATREALLMMQEYAREHVLLCLIPALFIAGAIAVFISQGAVMRYFGPSAHKVVSYTAAALSGTILAACSCTILPLFAGIYTRGAGLGPAIAFLYSGPAINVLAIILTARVLGWELGLARALGAIGLSTTIGLTMHLIYRKEERARQTGDIVVPDDEQPRALWQTLLYFATMIGILVFANWTTVDEGNQAAADWSVRVPLAGGLLVVLGIMLVRWFRRDELCHWVASTWTLTRQILPLLFVGVLVVGLVLGRPGERALIPQEWIAASLGGNSLLANLLAAMAGALMYIATLTEVPILDSLRGGGMGDGPALALLLAGPAVSLPNMLVIRSVLGTQKTLVYVALVVACSTLAGFVYGTLVSGGAA